MAEVPKYPWEESLSGKPMEDMIRISRERTLRRMVYEGLSNAVKKLDVKVPFESTINRLTQLTHEFRLASLRTQWPLEPSLLYRGLTIDQKLRIVGLAKLPGNTEVTEYVGPLNVHESVTLEVMPIARYAIVSPETFTRIGLASPVNSPSLHLAFDRLSRDPYAQKLLIDDPVFLAGTFGRAY